MKDTATRPQKNAAFVTSRKGFCYLTVKIGRRNFDLMRIRRLKEDRPPTGRRAGSLPALPLPVADPAARRAPTRDPFYGAIDPRTRTMDINDPSYIAGISALLNTILAEVRMKNS